jgi:hypothetical protein
MAKSTNHMINEHTSTEGRTWALVGEFFAKIVKVHALAT